MPSDTTLYRKKLLQPMRPYVPGEDMTGISVNKEDTPEVGGMIAVNPDNGEDRWYVAKQFFEDNYEVATLEARTQSDDAVQEAVEIARACGDWSVSKANCDDCPAKGRVTPCNGEPVSEACATITTALTASQREAADLRARVDAEAGKVATSDTSDGYHTFGELYHQRAILFAALINGRPEAWKSRQHSDGTMFDGGYFIVGIETPAGQYTYHYELAMWDTFNVNEREYAPEWDGHTADDVERLLSLTPQTAGDCDE